MNIAYIVYYYICLHLCAHILYFDAAKFSIKLFSFIYFTVSVVRQRKLIWKSDWNATHLDYITSSPLQDVNLHKNPYYLAIF